MSHIEIVPNERDFEAKQMYQFMSWFIRYHKKEIQNISEKVIEQMVLYGDVDWDKFFGEKGRNKMKLYCRKMAEKKQTTKEQHNE